MTRRHSTNNSCNSMRCLQQFKLKILKKANPFRGRRAIYKAVLVRLTPSTSPWSKSLPIEFTPATNFEFYRFPKAVLIAENEQGVEETYTKYLNSDDMILLVKDKFYNWSELLLDILNKKIEDREF